MDLVKTLLQEHGPSLVRALTEKAGFAAAEAQAFVPAAAETSFAAMKSGAVDLDALVGKRDVAALTQKLDLGALGAQCGLDAEKVAAGLKTIVPLLLDVLEKKGVGAGMLKALLGQGRGGFGGLAGLAGKFLGKG